jgi:hypothetical protein
LSHVETPGTSDRRNVRRSTRTFGSTVVILILVSLLPPNRPDRWLGGLGRSG